MGRPVLPSWRSRTSLKDNQGFHHRAAITTQRACRENSRSCPAVHRDDYLGSFTIDKTSSPRLLAPARLYRFHGQDGMYWPLMRNQTLFWCFWATAKRFVAKGSLDPSETRRPNEMQHIEKIELFLNLDLAGSTRSR
jgi:hypothetical protein